MRVDKGINTVRPRYFKGIGIEPLSKLVKVEITEVLLQICPGKLLNDLSVFLGNTTLF
jgi:hypothetical protein